MSPIKYKSNEYETMLLISNRKHLLVEGKDDFRFFQLLFEKFFGREWKKDLGLDVDTAEYLLQIEDVMENRGKVEFICISALGKEYEKKIVGFVDREFRDFQVKEVLSDLIQNHQVLGRLILSRGHSIENYLFDINPIQKSLRTLSYNGSVEEALVLFENIFESTIRIACAVSFTARDLNALSRIKASLNWDIYEISASNISIKLEKWETALIKRSRFNNREASNIISQFCDWLNIINISNYQNVRWACHGHVGLTIIWQVFAYCSYKVSVSEGEEEKRKEASHALSVNETIRFNECSNNWVNNLTPDHIIPSPVFQLLDLGGSMLVWIKP